MGDTVEEEEFGNDECLDEHAHAGCHDGEEDDDVADANGVQDDIAGAIKRFLEEWHDWCEI